MPKMSRKRPLILALAVALTIPAMSAVTASAAPDAPQPSQIVPKPVSTSVGQGQFTLERGARIVVQSAAALPVAQALVGYLRPATGYALPVATGQPAAS